MKAEDILKEARQTVAEKYGYKDWESVNWTIYDTLNTEASLLAMSKVAEQSWDAGYERCDDSYKCAVVIEGPDKSTYMNNLFPKI